MLRVSCIAGPIGVSMKYVVYVVYKNGLQKAIPAPKLSEAHRTVRRESNPDVLFTRILPPGKPLPMIGSLRLKVPKVK